MVNHDTLITNTGEADGMQFVNTTKTKRPRSESSLTNELKTPDPKKKSYTQGNRKSVTQDT